MESNEARDILYDMWERTNRRAESEALTMAVLALNKRIPTQPYELPGGVSTYGCNCGNVFNRKYNFCPYCGQRLDWSEVE